MNLDLPGYLSEGVGLYGLYLDDLSISPSNFSSAAKLPFNQPPPQRFRWVPVLTLLQARYRHGDFPPQHKWGLWRFILA